MIHVVTAAWGKLSWLAYPFLESLAHHWPLMQKRATVLTDDPEIKLPDYAKPFLITGPFASSLMAAMNDIREPVILWSCVDIFWLHNVPSHRSKQDRLALLAEQMVKRPDILRVGFAHVPAMHGYGNSEIVDEWAGMRVARCSDVRYCSLCNGMYMDVGLFNKATWLSVLEPHWSLWNCEIYGTEKVLSLPNITSLTTDPPLIRYVGISNDLNHIWWQVESLGKCDYDLIVVHKPREVKIDEPG